MSVHIASPVQTVVVLCAGAGFLIVWLVFPAKGAKSSFAADDKSSANSSGSPPPEDEPKTERAE